MGLRSDLKAIKETFPELYDGYSYKLPEKTPEEIKALADRCRTLVIAMDILDEFS